MRSLRLRARSCSSLVSINLPEGVKVLAKKAFEDCKLLTTVSLPQTLEEIGNEAFKE